MVVRAKTKGSKFQHSSNTQAITVICPAYCGSGEGGSDCPGDDSGVLAGPIIIGQYKAI